MTARSPRFYEGAISGHNGLRYDDIVKRVRSMFSILKEAFQAWNADNGPLLGAALAFYTFFSLAPLLIIAIAVSGVVLGPKAAQGQIVAQFQHLVGLQSARTIEWLILKAQRRGTGIAGLVGFVTLLVGASGVVSALQNAFDQIWKLPPRNGVKHILIKYALSYAMVLGLGFISLVSLLINAALAAVSKYLAELLPFGAVWIRVANLGVSFGGVTALFALMFHWLPQARPKWRDVWPGAAFTAFLFVAGKIVLALYLGRTAVGSMYGAAGSLAVVMLWVYYSAQILYLGAEFTKIWSDRRSAGKRIKPVLERESALTP